MKPTSLAQCLRAFLALTCGMLVINSGLLASEQVTQTGALNVLRKDHTATVLADGRVLVLGGQNDSGELASAEIYDSATRSFTPAGMMNVARVGHTATLLADGRVLVAGGRNAGGSLATAEIFDPATLTFQAIDAAMGAARVHHTATMLVSGKVLLAGGDLIGTAELFDPATQTFSSPLIAMIEPRAGQSATTLPENSVLLAGGGTRSVEVFDVQTSEFLSWPAMLSEGRTGQSAITTADTSIYFVGGEAFGTLEKFDLLGAGSTMSLPIGVPSSSATLLANGKVLLTGPVLASLFNPSTSGLSAIENSAPLQRSGQTLTELPSDKQILVVGGADANTALVSSAALYNPARIETDKADYHPDEPVIVNGSGWRPGEDVDLYVVDDLGWMYDSTVTANDNGEFVADPYFVVLLQHLDVTFDLTAIGTQSGLRADHTFTDASNKITKIGFVDSSAAAWVAGTAGGPINVQTRDTAGNAESITGSNNSVSISITSSSGTGRFSTSASGPFTSTTLTQTLSSGSDFPQFYYQDSNPGTIAITATVTARGSSGPTGLAIGATATLSKSVKATTTTSLSVTPNSASSVYGTSLTFKANVSKVNGSGTPSGSVTFKDGAATIGSATVNSGGVAQVSTSTLAVGPHSVTAIYNGDSNFDGSTSSAVSKTITQKTLTVVGAIANSKVYDGTTAVTVDFTSALLSGVETGDTVTLNPSSYTATFADKSVGNSKPVTVSGLSLGGSSASNYSLTQPTGLTANITSLSITGNFTVANKVYDGTTAATIATRALVGVVGNDAVNLAGGTATFNDANAGSGKTVTGSGFTLSGADAGNYTLGSVATTTADISKANATVNINGFTGPYDGNAHGASGTATGIGGAELSAGLDLGATFTNVPGGTANWTFNGGANYKDASGSVQIVINKANASISVTPYSVTYDGDAHTAAGAAKGVKNETLNGLDLSGTTHTNAGSYATDAWTFTDVTGNYSNASGTVSDSIAKANANITVTPYSVTYDGNAHTATGSAVGVKGESLSGLDLGGTTHINAGSYSDAWSFTDSTGNYNNQSGTASGAIAKADASISVNGYSGVYDAVAHGASGTATGVKSENLSSGLNLGAQFTDAPGGTAHWSFTGGVNYNDASGSVDIAIEQATATIQVQGYNVTYDATVHTASGSATGVNGQDLSGQLNLGATAHTNAGTYSDSWSFVGGTNYKDASGPVTDVITKADAVVEVNGYSGTYDGVVHGATGTATGVGGADLSASLDLGATFTDAPGGTAHWTFGGNPNYNDQSGDVAIVINKANATVNVTGYTGTYDAAAHGATGTATGVGGANLSASLDLGATFTNTPGGTAHWTFSGNPNYNDQSGDVAIVINKANATVNVTGYTGTYDAAAHGATGTATGVGGANLSASLDLGATFTDAPGGTAHWTFENPNYNDQSGDVAIVINKANATVNVTGYAGTYDGTAHGANGTATGVGGVNLSASLDLGATFTNAPGGTSHWTFIGGLNYQDQSGDVAIVINKANAAISVTPYAVTYDANSHVAVGTATGVNGENLAGLDLSSTTHTKAGTYATDSWSFTDATGNYNDASGTVSDSIAKAELKITANDLTKAFGEVLAFTGHEFTTQGLLGSDSIASVTLTSDGAAASALASGSPFDVTPSAAVGTGLDNYTIQYVKGKLTVTPLSFVGFLDPVGGSVELGNGGSFANPVRAYKLGSTIPVKFQIFSKGAVVTAGVHTLQAIKYSNATTSDPAIDASPTDAATSGNQFRLATNEWHFNLSTKGGFTAGTWLLSAKLADGTTHTVWIAVKK